MISAQALKDFQTIWENQFGEEISDELAMEESASLLTLFDAIYRPIKREWVNDNDNGTLRQHFE